MKNVTEYIKLLKHITYKAPSFSRPNKSDEQSIFIFGNGPSLNDIDYKKINGNICCVNSFPIKNKNFNKIKPKYFCLADPIYFNEKLYSNDEYELIEKLNNIDWKMFIICPDSYKNKLKITNKNIKYIYVDNFYSDIDDGKLKYFLYDNNMIGAGAQTVIVSALYYFIYSNTKTIYLCGVDMSEFKYYHVDINNNIYRIDSHFYKSKEKKEKISFVNKGEFFLLLSYYVKMLKEFAKLKIYADYKNIKIINTSENSYIDVFEKTNEMNIIKNDDKKQNINY